MITKNTQQASSSLVGKSQNCIVSNTMSLAYVVLMSCISFIGWKPMSLALMGLLLHMFEPYLTTYGSNFKSPDHPSSLNCQCDLVTNSFPSMYPFAHGDTIPQIFYALYEFYYDISEPIEVFYRVMNVFHQFGKKIHVLIHDMETTQEVDFV